MCRASTLKWLLSVAFVSAIVVIGTSGRSEDKPAEAKKAKDSAPAIDPKDVRVGPPPELAALREAVETAARKGENVDEIRAQLDALEKALAGKAWTKPKPIEDPLPPPTPPQFQNPGRLVVQPAFGFPVPDAEAMRRAQELLQKAQEELKADPKNVEAFQKAVNEYQRLMREAILQPGNVIGGGRVFVGPAGLPARQNDVRFGVRLERVPAIVANQFDLPVGKGLVAAEVINNTPAAKAGIQANDILVEFAGKPVPDTIAEFIDMVNNAKADEAFEVVVLRKGKKETVKGVTLPQVPKRRPIGRNGARVNLRNAAGQEMTSMSITNDRFTIHSIRDGVEFRLEGPTETGKPDSIKIVDGDKKIEVQSVDKVPTEYKEWVEMLSDGVRVR